MEKCECGAIKFLVKNNIGFISWICSECGKEYYREF